MAINETNKDKLKTRLSRTIGQLQGVYRMVEDERYCIDVLHQIKAVQASLDKTAEEILKAHLESCVVEAIQNQDQNRVMNELMEIFRKSPHLYDVAALPTIEVNPANKERPKVGCCN